MEDIKKYYTTCFQDINGNIYGKLQISENTYIDFGYRDIFRDGEPQDVSETAIRLIEYIFFRSPDVASYSKLLNVYGMYIDGISAHSSNDRQVLRNLFYSLRKSGLIDIKNKPGKGYFYKLDKKIVKFGVEGDKVSDMAVLFKERFGVYPDDNENHGKTAADEGGCRTCKNTIPSENCRRLSSKFFGDGAGRLMKASGEEALSAFLALSSVYGFVSSLSGHEGAVVEDGGNLFEKLYLSVVKECESPECGDVLKIKGPLGSYKNRIMQYLYIVLEKNNPAILPVYVDIAYYEKLAESDKSITEEELVKAFREDISQVQLEFSRAKGKTPLLMLDGVRDFSVGNEGLYYAIKDSLDTFNCKKIICLDSDFTVNAQHKFGIHPLTSASYCMYLRIRSMNLYSREESVEFIRNCIRIFNVKVPSRITVESIYENLVRLNFISVDAYWLVYLLTNAMNYILNPKNNISHIYEALAAEVLGSVDKVASAAELAYGFEFGKVDIGRGNPYYDIRWKLIRKHRSMLDFLIARRYMLKLSEISVDSGSGDNVRKLDFFNMVLQKRITRFIVSMLNGNDSCEHRIMVIAGKHYDDLSKLGKSELTFWMARLKNKARKTECRSLLKEFNRVDRIRYEKADPENITEKQDAAFLLRGSSVSLIYEGDMGVFRQYINSLVTDKIANSVNRGFHLEYYGDKDYNAVDTRLDYEDTLSKGENTFKVLCKEIDLRIRKKSGNEAVTVLELMTLCNLIQARTEKHDTDERVMDVSPYIPKCIGYIDYILTRSILDDLVKVRKYFRWFKDVLTDMTKNPDGEVCIRYNPADVYNTFSKAKSRPRKGWVNRNIPRPENIVEHMHGCWLIGMLYLPEKYRVKEYCKQTVLSMLIIHDMGETITGDIDRGEKNTDPETYALAESRAMDRLLFAGTYPEAVGLTEYMDCWNQLEAKEGFNAWVAKDIDEVQAVYQYCVYYKNHRELLTKEDARGWLCNIDKLKTDPAKDIAMKLIVNNPEFGEFMGEIYPL